MPSDIRGRFEQAIREEDEKEKNRLRAAHESAHGAEEKFEPVKRAAEELQEEIRSLPDIELTINPDNVWMTLADRVLWFGYNVDSGNFVGIEEAHSWYDGERCADRYEWGSADACVDAMIRLCAKHVRMARVIRDTSEQRRS